MAESNQPVPPVPQRIEQSQQESPKTSSAANSVPSPVGAAPPGAPPPPGVPPHEPQEEKRAEHPHPVTIWLSIGASIISIGSLILQQVNTIQARNAAAQAAEKQSADVERSRVAAENSARSAQILAETTQLALELQGRGATAAERSAQAAGSLAKDERIIRDIIARSQSARLIVRLQPYKDPKSGADSRKLYIANGSSVPALGVEVGYEIHTIGMPDQADLAWKLTPNEPEAVSESTAFYVKAIEKLRPRYSKDFLSPGTGDVVADTLPSPKWFFAIIPGKSINSSSIAVPHKYASSLVPTALRPAVVYGYVRYGDNANNRKKLPFCFPLDPKKADLNCQKVNPAE